MKAPAVTKCELVKDTGLVQTQKFLLISTLWHSLCAALWHKHIRVSNYLFAVGRGMPQKDAQTSALHVALSKVYCTLC